MDGYQSKWKYFHSRKFAFCRTSPLKPHPRSYKLKYIPKIHLDLFTANIIQDPYYGLNDFNLRWVTQENWTYSTPITGLNEDAKSTWLLFNGLDTFSSIEFCGKHVAATNNQFRQYWFDVSGILEECEGERGLSLNFGSVPRIVDEIANLPGQESEFFFACEKIRELVG
jgi:beta-mannosidase